MAVRTKRLFTFFVSGRKRIFSLRTESIDSFYERQQAESVVGVIDVRPIPTAGHETTAVVNIITARCDVENDSESE